MGRKKLSEGKVLRYAVKSRINEATYRKLTTVLEKSRMRSLSALIRMILSDKPVAVYSVDSGLVVLLEELTRMRGEFNAVGKNINQVVRNFNGSTLAHEKHLSVLLLIEEQEKANEMMEKYIGMLTEITGRWLQE